MAINRLKNANSQKEINSHCSSVTEPWIFIYRTMAIFASEYTITKRMNKVKVLLLENKKTDEWKEDGIKYKNVRPLFYNSHWTVTKT